MQSFQHSAFIAVLGLALSPLVAHASSPPTAYISAPSTTTSDHPRPAAKAAGVAALNVDAPRTVRLIYFLPNDRPYRAEVVQWIKEDIRKAQTFFAEQMQAHGYGNKTFRFETDAQGEPLVHRVDGQHPESHYIHITDEGVRLWQPNRVNAEVELAVDFYLPQNIYAVYSDKDPANGPDISASRNWKGSGSVDIFREEHYPDWQTLAHELGHTFGLGHDFRDGAYIMSYGGPTQFPDTDDRISACAAEFLSVHPYFNPAIPLGDPSPPTVEWDSYWDPWQDDPPPFPLEDPSPPTIKLISPTEFSSQSIGSVNASRVISASYPAGSKSISVQLKVGDAEGLHQVSFHANWTLRECRSFDGERNTVVDFDYDGSPTYAAPFRDVSSLSESPHWLEVWAVDTDGNMSKLLLDLFEVEAEPAVPHSLAKVSGDSQEGPASTQLDDPLVVSVLDADDAAMAGVVVSFSVTAGGGTLSVTTATTDTNGRARSTLTLGSEPGTNTVKATVEELEPITFTATAGEPASDSQEAPEPGPLSVTIDDVTSAAERGRMTFTVRLEPTPTAPTTVKYTTASQTATAGQDYEVASGTLDFDAGQSTATFTVRIHPDEQAEPNETFAVRITHPSTRALLAEATGTITDDDSATPPAGDSDGDDEMADGEMAFGFAREVEDQAYTAGTAISDLVLPEATGGEGQITYRVQGLPAGLSFDPATQTISGTPEAATDGAVEITYTAEDSTGEVATLTFSITINPALSFGDLFDLFGASGE